MIQERGGSALWRSALESGQEMLSLKKQPLITTEPLQSHTAAKVR
jgi:hypothetical protein